MMNEQTPINLEQEISWLRSHLVDEVLEFWEKHALDSRGGIFTCICDDGKIVSEDKWLWSQWRSVWIFSMAWMKYGRRDKWLEIAKGIADFCIVHGWTGDGWALRMNGNGEIQAGHDSFYVDCFAIYGLSALFQATGEKKYLEWGNRTAEVMMKALALPQEQLPCWPYPVQTGARVHGVAMMGAFNLFAQYQVSGDTRQLEWVKNLSDEIFEKFYCPERDVILERRRADGGMLPGPAGSVIVPGHVIENMWFQIHIAQALGAGQEARILECVRLIRRHLESGWDSEYGGLFLAIDADGGKEIGWAYADTKLWWPHTEALAALAVSYQITGESWCQEWYQKVKDYSLKTFYQPEFGEWTQKRDRQGHALEEVVALPVKDPFHLPRGLMIAMEAFTERYRYPE